MWAQGCSDGKDLPVYFLHLISLNKSTLSTASDPKPKPKPKPWNCTLPLCTSVFLQMVYSCNAFHRSCGWFCRAKKLQILIDFLKHPINVQSLVSTDTSSLSHLLPILTTHSGTPRMKGRRFIYLSRVEGLYNWREMVNCCRADDVKWVIFE